MADPARYYTARTLAAHWDVSRATVYREIERGNLECLHIGSIIRVPHQAGEEYERCRAAQETSPNTNSAVSPDEGTGTSLGLSAADLRKFQRTRMTTPPRGSGAGRER